VPAALSSWVSFKDLEVTDNVFMSLPCAQNPGGENPCIDTKDVLKLLIVGDSAVGC
jgi:hypothetical protein